MANIIIIGGGFAGLAALKKLAQHKIDADITLIDKKISSDFLPELPDVIGRGVDPGHLIYSIGDMAKRFKFTFIKAAVTAVDADKRVIHTSGGNFQYDYLIIASGSETNFYAQSDIERYAYKLDDAADAAKIRKAAESGAFDAFLVAGGGYTGVEVAANLRLYLNKAWSNKDVYIVERGPYLLGALTEDIKNYLAANLKRLNITALTNTTITKAQEGRVVLSGGRIFNKAMLVWAAGVKTDDFIKKLDFDKTPQGRLKVDEYLRVNERIFAAGDAASFVYKGNQLRMAVQFAIFQARCAALNIRRAINGERLKKYVPIDMGYVVPMANNRSCGMVFGIFVSGRLATFLHFVMCFYRSQSLKNGIGLITDLFKKSRIEQRDIL